MLRNIVETGGVFCVCL